MSLNDFSFTSQTFNIIKFQQNMYKNPKTICLCKIYELQSIEMTQKYINITYIYMMWVKTQ